MANDFIKSQTDIDTKITNQQSQQLPSSNGLIRPIPLKHGQVLEDAGLQQNTLDFRHLLATNVSQFPQELIREFERTKTNFYQEKAGGEQVIRFTQLYTPLPDTAKQYEKHLQIYRACKSKNATVSDYNDYLRNLRDYKLQLEEMYQSCKGKFYFQSDQQSRLTLAKPNYNERVLSKMLQQIKKDFEFSSEQQQKVGKESSSKQMFYNYKHQRLSIVWSCKQPVKRLKLDNSIVIELDKRVKNFQQTEKQQMYGQKIVCINYSQDSDCKRQIQSAYKFNDLFNTKTEGDGIMHPRPTINFGFEKRKVVHSKIVKCNQNPLNSTISGNHWGEMQQDAQIEFQAKSRALDYLPSLINQELQTKNWQKVLFPNQMNISLLEKYSKVWYNIADKQVHLEKRFSDDEDEIEEVIDNPTQSVSAPTRHQQFPQSENRSSKRPQSVNSDQSSHTLTTTQQIIQPVQKAVIQNNSIVANEYAFTKTNWTNTELNNLHRPNYADQLEEELRKNETKGLGLVPKVINPTQRVSLHAQLEENHISNAMIKSLRHISLRKGEFIVMEYIEKRPHLLQYTGMSGKIRRFYKGYRRSLEDYPKYVGTLGQVCYLDNNQEVPLLGQIGDDQGLSVYENKLYMAPIFYHDSRPNDFLLIRNISKRGRYCSYLRPIQYLYTVGQCEPKQEVFTPKSRNANSFQQKRIQAYIYYRLIRNNNYVTVHEVSQAFPTQSEGTLRKMLKNLRLTSQQDGTWTSTMIPNESDIQELVSPENICQFESMLYGQLKLQEKGISITSLEKLPYSIQKLQQELQDMRVKDLSNYIEDVVQTTPWNLTQAYIQTRKLDGMMRIEGIGDPTSGMCGYSFVKLPMKLPNNANPLQQNNPAEYLPNSRVVTGTDADLRGLTMEKAKEMLLSLGMKDEEINKLNRWKRVNELRRLSSQAAAQGAEGAVNKYARGVRVTTKMQKEKYQNNINRIFKKQIRLLGEIDQYEDDYSSDSEDDRMADDIAGLISKPEQDQRQNRDWSSDEEADDISQLIRNQSIREPQVVKQEQAKGIRTVMRRITKIPRLEGGYVIKVEFITNEEEIDSYKKKQKEAGKSVQHQKFNQKTANFQAISQKLNQTHKFKKPKLDNNLILNEKKKQAEQIMKQREQVLKHNQYTQNCIQKIQQGEEIEAVGAAKMRCSRCGLLGHMKTNSKKCPIFHIESNEPTISEKEGYIKSEGNQIKLTISKLEKITPKKKDQQIVSDYFKPKQISNRRRKYLEDNPYDDIAFKLIRFDHTKLFITPVKRDKAPNYYEVIKNPIDLESIRARARRGEYQSAQDFIADLDLLVDNAQTYNGQDHPITDQAKAIREQGMKELRDANLIKDN